MESAITSSWSTELRAMIKQLQNETILLALAGVCVAGLILLGSTPVLSDPVWSGVQAVAWLLALPVGLAMLMISRLAGVATASACTFLLLVAPAELVPVSVAERMITVLGLWSVLGMIWLTWRPLFTTVQWAWSGYERSQMLLEQTRDYQQQLHQALDDLTTSNAHLTRLNQQAHALRQIAEGERHAKEKFVANVSHELRTPLNMIIGFCEMITQSPETYGRGAYSLKGARGQRPAKAQCDTSMNASMPTAAC